MEDSKQGKLNGYATKAIRIKARRLIGKYGFTPDDYQDLMQEMTLDLLVRLPKFDPTRAGLDTFVSRIVNRKVADLIRHRRMEMRDYRREAGSLDGPDADAEDLDLLVGSQILSTSECMDLRLDLSLAVADLSPELQRLVEVLLTHSITEAARELGVPRSTLYGRGIARLRKALADKGLDEYL